jgi:hypothetical protein
MSYLKNIIVTNNPSVAEKNADVIFIDGSVESTLIKVRDMVHEGHELISHPLPASLRMMFSPFRSVILSKCPGKVDFFCVEIIEDSIIKYKRHMSCRKMDRANADDYRKVDLLLLESALQEQAATW